MLGALPQDNDAKSLAASQQKTSSPATVSVQQKRAIAYVKEVIAMQILLFLKKIRRQ